MPTPEVPDRIPQIPPPPMRCAAPHCTRQALNKSRFCADCYDEIRAFWPMIDTRRRAP